MPHHVLPDQGTGLAGDLRSVPTGLGPSLPRVWVAADPGGPATPGTQLEITAEGDDISRELATPEASCPQDMLVVDEQRERNASVALSQFCRESGIILNTLLCSFVPYSAGHCGDPQVRGRRGVVCGCSTISLTSQQ